MRYTIRQVLTAVLAFAIILHEPSLKATINLLINLHIFLRIALDRLQSLFGENYPTISDWCFEFFNASCNFLKEQSEWIFEYIVQVLHMIADWATHRVTASIQESPRYLCEMNEQLVYFGDYLVQRLPADRSKDLALEWKAAGEEVARYCLTIREGAPM